MEPTTLSELQGLAQDICSEQETCSTISKGWYDFKQPNSADVNQLSNSIRRSREHVSTLSNKLNSVLAQSQTDLNRDQLQYAYNLVEELLQSRAAVEEMISVVKNGGATHPEYFRAIALKEHAAEEQAEKLTHLLQKLSNQTS